MDRQGLASTILLYLEGSTGCFSAAIEVLQRAFKSVKRTQRASFEKRPIQDLGRDNHKNILHHSQGPRISKKRRTLLEERLEPQFSANKSLESQIYLIGLVKFSKHPPHHGYRVSVADLTHPSDGNAIPKAASPPRFPHRNTRYRLFDDTVIVIPFLIPHHQGKQLIIATAALHVNSSQAPPKNRPSLLEHLSRNLRWA